MKRFQGKKRCKLTGKVSKQNWKNALVIFGFTVAFYLFYFIFNFGVVARCLRPPTYNVWAVFIMVFLAKTCLFRLRFDCLHWDDFLFCTIYFDDCLYVCMYVCIAGVMAARARSGNAAQSLAVMKCIPTLAVLFLLLLLVLTHLFSFSFVTQKYVSM